MSASVEIICYWAWLIISVWENEPKLKETTVNHFALRHYWWIEVYACSEHGNLVKKYARIVWASFISSLEVARYDCLPHRFSPTFQSPLFSVENWKKKVIFNSCVNLCNFLKLFRFWLLLFHVSWLSSGLRFLLLFNSRTSAVTACTWVSFRKLELIPGFHFYITEINSKHQSSFLLGLEVGLMLLLAILNSLKSFRWFFLMFANNWIYWEVVVATIHFIDM